jgi:3-(3-hydroxy-phenyl)propionate hydroxylase
MGGIARVSYAYTPFDYITPPELSNGTSFDAPIIIVGAGPIGLTAAIDLALHGKKSIILDDNNVVSIGSRAICWSKRTLEIFDRLGVGERMVKKGITWKIGRCFNGDDEVFSFNLLPEDGHKMPAFINLQQYYVEEYLIERVRDFPDMIDLRFKNKVISIAQDNKVNINIETPDGHYQLEADYLLACDGANSDIRQIMGLAFEGQKFEEQFLIADIKMQADFPSERWFWFNPSFHEGQTALLHKQPDDIYRIDLQLSSDADIEEAKKAENVIPRIKRAVAGRDFELDWVSVYKFRCNRLERFVHDHVIFVGDSAHVVSPFGARGGNGGIQDVDNLCWKLAMVLDGGDRKLLESYNEERIYGADENLRKSAQTSHFMQPPNETARLFRDAVLDMAKDKKFAQPFINPGRLSTPCSLAGFALQTPNHTAPYAVGQVAIDAPFDHGYLLNQLGGTFKLLAIACDVQADIPVIKGDSDMLMQRYGTGVYLIRPDQHIAAYWPTTPNKQEINMALARAKGEEYGL